MCSVSESSSQWSALGLTIIGDELFLCVRTDDKTIVEIYDLRTFRFKRRWTAESYSVFRDFKGCKNNNCLYFLIYRAKENRNRKQLMTPFESRAKWLVSQCDAHRDDTLFKNTICRYSSTGNLIASWPVDDAAGHSGQLSVTDEGNILFTPWTRSKLQEYTPDGQLILTIQLHWNDGFQSQSLKHAIKLNSRHYLVSHGDGSELLRRICLIDCNGKIINCYDKTGVKDSSNRLKCLVSMTKDSKGNILVVDSGHRCVMVLGADLKPINEGITLEEDAVSSSLFNPQIIQAQYRRNIVVQTMIIDEENGRIFGIEENREGNKGPYVTVFTFNRKEIYTYGTITIASSLLPWK